MENIARQKVGDIVASNFRTSKVLTAHNIDFCCGGGISLQDACLKKNQNLDTVIAELEEILQSGEDQNWQELDPDKLIDRIVQKHHSYILGTIPALRIYLDKLCNVHGERHNELYEIRSLFEEGSIALLQHMEKEEKILFPYIKAMVSAERDGFPLSKPHFEHIENPIQIMEAEHATEGVRFMRIAQLTNNYTCPPDGCQTFKVTYALLQEFEEDLHTHIHLENNVLFPASRRMFSKQMVGN
ncbi:MAG: iron-sulfur cluster repair di-iron protein [Cytophagales bacterium]